jgi:hypothetical protein
MKSLIAVVHALTLVIAIPLAATAQEELAISNSNGIKLDKQLVQRWKCGMTITAKGPCFGILGTTPVPTDWPEQQVRIVDEDFSKEIDGVKYRTLENGVKQMLIAIRGLRPGQQAHAFVTFEVTRSSILGPDDPTQFEKPKKLTKELKKFVEPSPAIESKHGKIRALARKLVNDDQSAWEQVETMYDWVRDNVEYTNGPLKGALAALNDGNGDCEELTSLFIALCRANRIPARTVWIPGHCYPEFYLQDQEGVGHWFPCQAAGTRDFGSMPDHRPILQKGDNYKVPEKKAPQRYVAEFLKGNYNPLLGKPEVEFVRQLVDAE